MVPGKAQGGRVSGGGCVSSRWYGRPKLTLEGLLVGKSRDKATFSASVTV